MNRLFLVTLGALLLTSCASILNQDYTKIKIHTTEPSTIMVNGDTIETDARNKATIFAERIDAPLFLVVETGQLQKKVDINYKNSVAYYLNIPNTYGLGMLIDKDNPKRFTYPRNIYLNSANTEPIYFNYDQSNPKGAWYLNLSLPYINQFSFHPESEIDRKKSLGFWGIGFGLDYYHQEHQFLNFSGKAVTNSPIPIIAAIDFTGEFEWMYSTYFSFSNNHKWERFSFGYGLSLGSNTWDLRFYDTFGAPPPIRTPIKRKHYALGVVLPVYHQLGPTFHLGLIYRPTFFRFNTIPSTKYEHLISLDLVWKFRLR